MDRTRTASRQLATTAGFRSNTVRILTGPRSQPTLTASRRLTLTASHRSSRSSRSSHTCRRTRCLRHRLAAALAQVGSQTCTLHSQQASHQCPRRPGRLGTSGRARRARSTTSTSCLSARCAITHDLSSGPLFSSTMIAVFPFSPFHTSFKCRCKRSHGLGTHAAVSTHAAANAGASHPDLVIRLRTLFLRNVVHSAGAGPPPTRATRATMHRFIFIGAACKARPTGALVRKKLSRRSELNRMQRQAARLVGS
jgi:hypothetical protein